jgi:hypothetical protein
MLIVRDVTVHCPGVRVPGDHDLGSLALLLEPHGAT